MIVKLLTERHLEFESLKDGYRGSSESTLVKMSNFWKSQAVAHYLCSDSNFKQHHGLSFVATGIKMVAFHLT